MASTIKSLYGTSNQSITCTFTSLGNQQYRQSASIDNSTNLFLDVLVTVKIKTNAAGTSSTGAVQVYVYGSTDGSTFDGSCSGSDASYSPPMATPVNLAIGMIVAGNTNATADQRSFSVAQCFGGVMPQKWGIVVFNNTGAALDASVGSAWYQGIQAQSV